MSIWSLAEKGVSSLTKKTYTAETRTSLEQGTKQLFDTFFVELNKVLLSPEGDDLRLTPRAIRMIREAAPARIKEESDPSQLYRLLEPKYTYVPGLVFMHIERRDIREIDTENIDNLKQIQEMLSRTQYVSLNLLTAEMKTTKDQLTPSMLRLLGSVDMDNYLEMRFRFFEGTDRLGSLEELRERSQGHLGMSDTTFNSFSGGGFTLDKNTEREQHYKWFSQFEFDGKTYQVYFNYKEDNSKQKPKPQKSESQERANGGFSLGGLRGVLQGA